MATNKRNQMSVINEEDIKKALETFKSAYKENKKQYEEKNARIEDVVNLTKGFSGKSALLVSTVTISVMTVMPSKEPMALMDEAIKEILKEEMKKGADNDIYN